MTDTDHSGTDPRPPLEEFIRLTSEPGCSWGMADSDVVEICNYALRLESRLSAIRKETIEEAAKVADAKAAQLKKLYSEQDDEDWGEIAKAYHGARDIADRIRALAGGRDG